MAPHVFQWPDYLIFAMTMVFTLAIGVYHAVLGKSRTTTDYLQAGRKMNAFPITVSLLISYISAVTLIGNGSEMYFYGIHFWFYVFSTTIALILCTLLFVPLYHPLNLVSVQQYLVLRYDSRLLELCGTGLQLLAIVIMNALFLFGPCVMLQAVTVFPTWLSLIVTGLIATIYTSIGGFKAVIWADVFQAAIILIGLVFIVIQGVIVVGGVPKVWKHFADSGRFDIDFDLSPLKRLTFPTATVVMTAQWLAVYGVLQPSAQRILSVGSQASARRVYLGVIPGVFILGTLSCALGIVAFAYFDHVGCDPLGAGLIRNQNQIVSYFVMEIIDLPVIPGLFMTCVFVGSLSNLSSFLHSASTIMWNDLFSHWFQVSSEAKKILITKLLVVLSGVLSVAASFVVANAGGTLTQIMFAISSAPLTPIFLLFALGATFPWINWKSALCGALVGFIIPTWMSIGTRLQGSHTQPLPFSMTNCSQFLGRGNPTTPIATTWMADSYTSTIAPPSDVSALDTFYSTSQYWYQPIGILAGMAVALLVSAIPTFRTKERDPRLYFPYVRWILRRCTTDQDYEMKESLPTL